MLFESFEIRLSASNASTPHLRFNSQPFTKEQDVLTESIATLDLVRTLLQSKIMPCLFPIELYLFSSLCIVF